MQRLKPINNEVNRNFLKALPGAKQCYGVLRVHYMLQPDTHLEVKQKGVNSQTPFLRTANHRPATRLPRITHTNWENGRR
jgi:hypothetical protein